jgi:hypothetical protein
MGSDLLGPDQTITGKPNIMTIVDTRMKGIKLELANVAISVM